VARAAAKGATSGCLLLAFGLAAAPAAHAAFTDSALAATTFGTAVIGSPTDISVTPACTSKKSLTLTVNVEEAVPYANLLDVTITSGTETTTSIQDIGIIDSHTLTVSAAKGHTVDFTYTVRGLYQPAGSSTVWRSAAPLVRTVSCT
jgi:hypothetical protein